MHIRIFNSGVQTHRTTARQLKHARNINFAMSNECNCPQMAIGHCLLFFILYELIKWLLLQC